MNDALDSNYLIAPLTTQLQRRGLWGQETSVYVLINMSDERSFAARCLVEELAALPKKLKKSVRFNARCLPNSGSGPFDDSAKSFSRWSVLFQHSELVERALHGIARESGFRHFEADVYLPSFHTEWADVVADFAAHEAVDQQAVEEVHKDDLVEVYPVRTALCRFETSSSECVLRYPPIMRQIDPDDVPAIEASAERLLSELALPKRHKVALFIRFSDEATGITQTMKDVYNRLIDRQLWQDRFGFETCTLHCQ